MTKIIKRKKIKCAFCKGTGVQPRYLKSRCFNVLAITCPSCKGKGRSPGELGLACIRCKGVGVLEKGEAVDVLVEHLGEITKHLSWMRKEAEKKTKEIEKQLKPVEPFIKEVKKETVWFQNLENKIKEGWKFLWKQ